MTKTALLVMEMQNDYLWEKRKAKFPYDTETLIGAVNDAIAQYRAAGSDILYLLQIFPDTPSNRIIFDFSITGTEGAELYSGLDVVSEYLFEKNVADAFLDPAFAAFVSARGYTDIAVCGIDECGAVSATAKGANNFGANVAILKHATASRLPINKLAPLRAELRSLGIQFI